MEIGADNIGRYLAKARKSPRLTSLIDEFGSLTAGKKGRPQQEVFLDRDLLGHDALALAFSRVRHDCAGTFNGHFVASIPYILEEQCRFGAAILHYGKKLAWTRQQPLNVYTLGDASGVMSRALTTMSRGAVRTLTCSPNEENRDEFYAKNPPEGAYFFHGPFFDVTAEMLKRKMTGLEKGFDIIIEDTTFQMYGLERLEPFFLACRNLKEDGIFVVVEKLRHPEMDEYIRRERQKDLQFKKKYFTPAQIEEKRHSILANVEQQEVTLEKLAAALRSFFSAAVITWNSGNFYTIAASNSRRNLAAFVGGMIPAAIQSEYCYENLPRPLFGKPGFSPRFRVPGADPAAVAETTGWSEGANGSIPSLLQSFST